MASQGLRTEKKVITVDGESAGRIRNNPLAPNLKMSSLSKSRQNLQKTREDEVTVPLAGKTESPDKAVVSKTRQKYANVPSKIQSGVA